MCTSQSPGRRAAIRLQSLLPPVSLSLVLLAALLATGCDKPAEKKGGPPRARPAPVAVQEAVRRDVPVEIRTFGNVEPFATVDIKPQITGVLTNIGFREGQDVKTGDVLFRIDALPWEIALRQVEAGVAKDTALWQNAVQEVEREEALLKKDYTSKGNYDLLRANAESLAATVRSDEAAVENARVRIDYCTIRSPIDGRTGKRAVDLGNVVKENETTLVTINRIQPIIVSFAVPEQELAAVRREMAAREVEVQAFLPEAPDAPEKGTLTFVDNRVDRGSGTIVLNAAFANKAGRLWPGQYVTVNLVESVMKEALVIPFRALQTGQKGTYVYVVAPNLTAEYRAVKPVAHVAEDSVIEEGLQPGDRVVVEGEQRVGPGSPVEIISSAAKKAGRGSP